MLIKYLSRKLSRNHFHLQEQRFNKVSLATPGGHESGHQQSKGGRFEGYNPEACFDTCESLLQYCINEKSFGNGKKVHAFILKTTFVPRVFVYNTLIKMYLACACLNDAHNVFEKMIIRNVFTWTMLIAGYAKHNNGKEALQLFTQMQLDRVSPDRVTFVGVLSACADLSALEKGKWVHSQVLVTGCNKDVIIGSALVDVYIKCASVEDAFQVFGTMPERNIFTWTTIVTGYAQYGYSDEALDCFMKMQEEGIAPNEVTFVNVLSACTHALSFAQGKWCHVGTLQARFTRDIYLNNTVLDMYCKCKAVEYACQVFDRMPARDAISWNSMVTGYAQNGHENEALMLFRQMQLEGISINASTSSTVLSVCATASALGQGKLVHAVALHCKFSLDNFVSSALVDMYAKCWHIDGAWQTFDRMPARDIISWNAMIAGFAQCKNAWQVMKVYRQMQQEGIMPDSGTFVGVLSACSGISTLNIGELIHHDIHEAGCESSVLVASALFDMYAKCGSIEDARHVFDKMPGRDVVSWNAIITAYAQHGNSSEAFKLFWQMQQEGWDPNGITFIAILTACRHAHLVDEARIYFDLMAQHGISPSIDHYACMVDVLGRAGQLSQAKELIQLMPFKPSVEMLMSLLGACRIHSNMHLAEDVFDYIMELDSSNASACILLSNMYATVGIMDFKTKILEKIKALGLKSKGSMLESILYQKCQAKFFPEEQDQEMLASVYT